MAKYRFDQIAKECRATFKGDMTDVPIVGLEHIIPNEMLLFDCDRNVETTFTKSFKEGQILFGRRRAYQQKACVATFDGICSGDITVIEAIEEKVYPRLLPFIIQNDNFFEHAIKGSNGALSPRVKWEHIATFEIKLPAMEEQQILAEKLWSAYELKHSYQDMIKATDEMVKSQFIEMFGGHSNVIKLRDVVTIMDDKRKPINEGDRSAMKDGELYPYYGATGVVDYINDYLTDERLLCIAEDCGNYGPGEESSYIIEGKAWVNNHAHVVKPNDELCDITYLHNFLKVTDLLPFVSGTTRKKLTQKAMSDLDIILPPIDKQREYVFICNQADKSKFELKQSIEAIDKVIKSLINENL